MYGYARFAEFGGPINSVMKLQKKAKHTLNGIGKVTRKKNTNLGKFQSTSKRGKLTRKM